jgi:hypothetical protein
LRPGWERAAVVGTPIVDALTEAERCLERSVPEHRGVCNATVYRLCDSGELPHVWIVNSIRIRPADLQAFLDRQAVGREPGCDR